MLAAISHADVGTLFVVLAILAFAVALYLAYLGNHVGAVVAAFIGVVILLVN